MTIYRISTPPSVIRTCESAHASRDRQCKAGASAWLSEVAYCWGHMPADWRVIAERRRARWADLAPLLWREICEEAPGP